MRVLIQRVNEASVTVDKLVISKIAKGLLIFVCAMADDTEQEVEKLVSKISKIRIFSDIDGKMNKSVIDIEGEALIVSQFTLSADTSRGNRPGFSKAAEPERGNYLYKYFISKLKETDIKTLSGEFGGDMQVSLINNGPTTIWIDTKI